jgi:hypothetical protein
MLNENYRRLFQEVGRITRPRPAKAIPKRRPGKSRKRLSMRPEKRPQTIMEQYRYREMMRQPHNRPLKFGLTWGDVAPPKFDLDPWLKLFQTAPSKASP